MIARVSHLLASLGLRRDLGARSLSYYCVNTFEHLKASHIQQLIEHSIAEGRVNTRICLHSAPPDPFHDMIIVEYQHNYYPPHRHPQKGETHHIIQGEMAVLVFDDKGSVTNGTILGGPSGSVVSRVGTGLWHTILPLSEIVVYHESKPGPFLGEQDRIFPDWAPRGGDHRLIAEYRAALRQQVDLVRRRGSQP